MKIKHYLLTPLIVASMAIFSERTFAFDFKFGDNETVLLNDDFKNKGEWQFSTDVKINSDYLIAEKDYQTASLNLIELGIGPLSPTDGAINLYWSAIFPDDFNKERNAYIPALQYAENPLFCWNQNSGEVITREIGSSCSDLEAEGFQKVEENAELRAWLRPQTRSEKPLTRLYVDPDFTPGVEPEERDPNEFAYMGLKGQVNSVTDYRMRIEEIDGQVEVELSFFNNNNEWESIGDRLVVKSSQWKYVTGQNEDGTYTYGVEESVSFESINILLRRLKNRKNPNKDKDPTEIDAIALTQEKIFDSKSVPETTSVFSLLVAGALGRVRWNRQKK